MTPDNPPTPSRGIHHVAIRASDFDASVRFYRDVLGFREMLRWGRGEQQSIMLDAGDDSCVEIFAAGVAGEKPEGHWLHLALKCDDVDVAVAAVRKAGREVTMEPTDVDIPSDPPVPVRIAFFKGPDGEIIEFFQSRS